MLYTRRHGENYPSMRYPPPYRIGYGSTVDIEEKKTTVNTHNGKAIVRFIRFFLFSLRLRD